MCKYILIYLFKCIYIYIYTYLLFIYLFMYLFIYSFIHVFMYLYICVCVLPLCVCACACVYVQCVCVYVCMYVGFAALMIDSTCFNFAELLGAVPNVRHHWCLSLTPVAISAALPSRLILVQNHVLELCASTHSGWQVVQDPNVFHLLHQPATENHESKMNGMFQSVSILFQ